MWWVMIGVLMVLFIGGMVYLAIRPFMPTPTDEEIARDMSSKLGERAAEEWLVRRS